MTKDKNSFVEKGRKKFNKLWDRNKTDLAKALTIVKQELKEQILEDPHIELMEAELILLIENHKEGSVEGNFVVAKAGGTIFRKDNHSIRIKIKAREKKIEENTKDDHL